MASSTPTPAPSAAPFSSAAFEELFAHLPFSVGRDLSVRDREERGVDDLRDAPALAYGETPLSTVAAALLRIEQPDLGGVPRGTDFLDVGSGTGKPVFAAALLFTSRVWRRCVGVELLPSLFQTSLEVLDAFRGGLPFLQKGVKETQYRIPAAARSLPIDFFCGDAVGGPGAEPLVDGAGEEVGPSDGLDWSRVGVAYACSTCFDEETMAKLAVAASAMRPGSYFVTASMPLPTAASQDKKAGAEEGAEASSGPGAASDAPAEPQLRPEDVEWDVVAELTGQQMSWSANTSVYIQRRRGVAGAT
jgi:hypothetical protein